ncbi:MAG: GNAT family N-acetyltransferase [Pseudomonadota bacterium]
MVITIRDVRPDELPWVQQTNNDATPAVNHLEIERLEQLYGYSALLRIAELDGTPAGFLLAMTADSDYDSVNYRWFQQQYEQFVYIDRVVIAPGFRRKGVGRVLYADIQSFTEQNAPLLTCEVNLKPSNPGSVLFHSTYGFHEVGQQDTEGGDKRVSLLAMPTPAFESLDRG